MGRDLDGLLRYTGIELHRAFSDLTTILTSGLKKLSFADNFEHFFEEDVVFAATTAVTFTNQLQTANVIWFPVRITYDGAGTVMHLIETQATPITKDKITLYNASAQVITATILVMRR